MYNITLFAADNTMPSTLTGPMDVLSASGLLWGAISGKQPTPHFQLTLATETGAPVACYNGLTLSTAASCMDIHQSDIILIPSLALGDQPLQLSDALVTWLQKMHQQGTVIATVCTGAFVIAAAGLLDHRRATTHWAYQESLQQQHPEIEVIADQILVDEGNIITSGGGSAWHDLVLYLIERYVDAEAAVEASKLFLLDRHIDTQTPYSFLCQSQPHSDLAITRAQQWITQNHTHSTALAGAIDVSGLSSRTFSRRFRQVTGMTPITFQQNLRLEDAKRQLESTKSSVETISINVGYDNVVSFRRLFKKRVGILPADYRKMFYDPQAAKQ